MPNVANWIQKNMGGLSATITVTAAMIAAGSYQQNFPFTPSRFLVQVRTATGGIRRADAGDTFVITGNGVLITFDGGASPDIQDTDIVTILAWA